MGKIPGLVIGAVVLVGGVWWAVQMNTADKMSPEKDAMQKKETAMAPKEDVMKKDEAVKPTDSMPPKEAMMEKPAMEKKGATGDAMMAKGTYVEYGPGVVEGSKNTKRVLFFYASWCPVCKPADAEFRDKMGEIPAGVTVIRVNYNDPETDQAEKDLATQYGVTYQHTFVQIDQDGKALTKWNGGKLAEFVKNIK